MEDTLIRLMEYSELLHVDNIFSWMFRHLGWYIIKFLGLLLNSCQNLVDDVIGLNAFFYTQEIEDFISSFKPILYLVLVLSITFLGYRMIMNQKDKFSSIVNNFLIALCVVTLLPNFMMKLNKLTMSAVEATGTVSDNKILANKIIKDNVNDLLLLDAVDFDFNKLQSKNNIPEKDILRIEINEVITDTNNLKNKELFRKKIAITEEGQTEATDLSKGFLGVGDEHYYRYSINFFTIMITLLILSATFITTSLKIAMIIFKLPFYEFFAFVASFSDLSTGQRMKKAITIILSLFLTFFLTMVIFKFYIMSTSWISNNTKGILYLIMMIASSLVVIIESPRMIQSVLGSTPTSRGNPLSRYLNKTKGTAIAVAGSLVNSNVEEV